MNLVAVSILTCNCAYLGDAILSAQAGGADYLHVDIIDGMYGGNYSFGPKTVSDLKAIVDIPVEVHLELYNPQDYLEQFLEAGADRITIQLDSCACPIRALDLIRSRRKKAGIGISPTTGLQSVEYLAPHLDYIVMLSVEPGFGGQKTETTIYKKLRELKEILRGQPRNIPVLIDGGVCEETAPRLLQCGADILVVGSSVYSRNDISHEEIVKRVQYFKNVSVLAREKEEQAG